MWEVTKAPTASWASLGSGGGAPGLHLTFPVTQLTIQATFFFFSDVQMKLFCTKKKKRTHSPAKVWANVDIVW